MTTYQNTYFFPPSFLSLIDENLTFSTVWARKNSQRSEISECFETRQLRILRRGATQNSPTKGRSEFSEVGQIRIPNSPADQYSQRSETATLSEIRDIRHLRRTEHQDSQSWRHQNSPKKTKKAEFSEVGKILISRSPADQNSQESDSKVFSEIGDIKVLRKEKNPDSQKSETSKFSEGR